MMTPLLSVEQAIEQILGAVQPLAPQATPLLRAVGCVLAETVVAAESLPPFDNSGMDGYAVIAADVKAAQRNAPVTLHVAMDLPAGRMPMHTLMPGEAARIMTGAPLPPGADAVVPVEETDSTWMNDASASLPQEVAVYVPAQTGANVRKAGHNVRAGQQVLTAGVELNAPEIGMLAALGIRNVQVYPRPKVAVVTSGDELVPYDGTLATGQIRDANSPALFAALLAAGAEPHMLPIARDTPEALRALYDQAVALQPDAIVSTAGVSVGAADFTRQVLEETGKVALWRINIRPGKPLAFGNIQGIPFFGLPGNPVSALITFDVLVKPAIYQMNQRRLLETVITAQVTHDVHSDGRKSYLRVTLQRQNDRWLATETGTQSSGALMSLVLADGLMIVPEDVRHVPAGSELTVKLWRNLAT
jgi:molybdopterin molybdotransferase